jgi:RimJ/RimL family protein N-acetyltransferase
MIQTVAVASADHKVELTSETLLLRAFRMDDAEAIHQAVRESLRELGQWLSWCHKDYAIQDTLQFLGSRAEAFAKDGEYAFAIIERASGRFVGATGINQVEKAALRANLGYWLRTSATKRGYATGAGKLVARWAFESQGLERIEIVAATGNLASQKVALRMGATREGIARKRLRVHGVQHDALVFSLVRGDVPGETS